MAEMFENGYAVVIGVDANNIQRLALPTVAKDVQALYDVLVHPERCAYKPDNVRLLKGEESTQNNILDTLYWLQEQIQGDDQATVVIYYSGHGMVDQATDQYYLIPYDIRALSRVRADAIKADTLTAEISAIQAKRLLVILDCCHAAGMDVKDVDLSAADAGVNVQAASFPIDLPETKDIPEYAAAPGSKEISDLYEGEGRAILNSSTGAQSSYVRRDRTMSLFTYHLIEALTGHAPHPDDATVVYVTDVMSWVTHEVKKSARREGVDQTPVMRTSGVFPVAQLIGGQGLAKGLGQTPPDPLESLPPAGQTTTIHQEGQTVHGPQVIAGGDAHIGQIGDSIDTGGGDYVGGDKFTGDKVGGDKIAGSKAGRDVIDISGVTGSTIAIGGDAAGGDMYKAGRDMHVGGPAAASEATPAELFQLLQAISQEMAAIRSEFKERDAREFSDTLVQVQEEVGSEEPDAAWIMRKLDNATKIAGTVAAAAQLVPHLQQAAQMAQSLFGG